MIPGTKVKGRIDFELSAEGTKRIFSASYRGTPLMQKEIRNWPVPELALSGQFHGFSLYDDTIIIEESQLKALTARTSMTWIDTGGMIAIHDHPALLAAFKDKGWLGLDERKSHPQDSVTAKAINSLIDGNGQSKI